MNVHVRSQRPTSENFHEKIEKSAKNSEYLRTFTNNHENELVA